MYMVATLLGALLGQAPAYYSPAPAPAPAPPITVGTETTVETLGAPETLNCKVQKILTGPLAGQYRILAVLPTGSQQPSDSTAAPPTVQLTDARTEVSPEEFADLDLDRPRQPGPVEIGPGHDRANGKLQVQPNQPKGELVNGETLGPLLRVNLEGYGDCEARQILQGPPAEPQREVGRWRIVRQLTPPAPVTPPAPAGDPYGFINWLNGVRASYGLGAVGYDQNLTDWAAMNNAQQQAQGLGHFVMGPARRQNAAMGGSFPGDMWMNSGGHRAALLDPTISWIGIAAAGAYWTFNAY